MTVGDNLLAAVRDVAGARAVRYGLHDDRGASMDTLKVVEHPDGGYLGVYHNRSRRGGAFHVLLASSTDLLTWRQRAVLDPDASQPVVTALPGGGFLVAVEAAGTGRASWLRLLRYADAQSLLTARPDGVVDLPHTMVPPDRLAEGTPHIDAATADLSVIEIGFHYFRDGLVDRQARGRLSHLRSWRAEQDPDADAAVEAHGVRGNIGGRDVVEWHGARLTLIEGQLRRGDWGSWRVFRYDRVAGTAWPVPIRTHGGSVAFANPKLTLLTAPSGRPALLTTMFVFAEGAARGEAGPLLYYRELDE
jgi:hypothetical protein